MSTIWIVCKYASTPEVGGHLRQHYLARELARLGHNVYVISGREHHLMTRPEVAKAAPFIEDVAGYKMVRLDTVAYPHAHHKKRILSWIQFGWKIRGLTRKGVDKPDLVLHSSPELLGFLGSERVAKKTKAKLAFEVRDIWPLTLTQIGNIDPKHPFMRVMQWVENRAYNKSDLVLSNLANASDHMVAHGMAAEKFKWIPNGYDLGDVGMQEPLSPEYESQFPKDKFIVGYAGTHGEANNLDVLLDAALQVKDDPRMAVVLVGGGKSKADLVARAQELNLSNVHFVDAVPKQQVQSVLAKFDVCYIGLPPEPLFLFGVSPNKLFDYFAAAKPVLYAIDSGKYNPVDANKAGIVVEPGNSQALAAAMIKLASLPKAELIEAGKNGKHAIQTQYNYTALGEELNEAILKTLNQAG